MIDPRSLAKGIVILLSIVFLAIFLSEVLPPRVINYLHKTRITQEKTEKLRELEKIRALGGKIEYIKDSRTGFCYAYLWQSGPALSNVECTKEVEALIR